MKIKLELFSPEMASFVENKELPSHFRVYRKGATSTKTDGQMTKYGPLHISCYIFCLHRNVSHDK